MKTLSNINNAWWRGRSPVAFAALLMCGLHLGQVTAPAVASLVQWVDAQHQSADDQADDEDATPQDVSAEMSLGKVVFQRQGVAPVPRPRFTLAATAPTIGTSVAPMRSLHACYHPSHSPPWAIRLMI